MIQTLAPMDLTAKEIKEMLKVADADDTGDVDKKEFVNAYHSPEWKKVLRSLQLALIPPYCL